VEPLALSAVSLLEIAVLASQGKLKLRMTIDEFFDHLQASGVFQVFPLTYEVAAEVASLGSLRDPADRAIVATARVERLRLVTSDQRIIESKLVSVVA
jgi:PIN domain nuclease of toxin-antitoxin system